MRHAFVTSILLVSVFTTTHALAEEAPNTPATALSTSGTDIAPASPPNNALNDRVVALEKELAQLKEKSEPKPSIWDNLKISGYAQAQFYTESYSTDASPNLVSGALPPGISANEVIAKRDGTTTNATTFRMRRTRLKADFETRDMGLIINIDPLPFKGALGDSGSILRNGEVIGKIHWAESVHTLVAMGLMNVPFGYEIVQSSRERPFVERAWGTRNMFPGERDLGIRADTALLQDRMHVIVAVLNGHPVGAPDFTLKPDLNASKDLLAQVHYEFGSVDVGVSGYYGKGERVDATSLTLRSFGKWGVNVQAGLHHTFAKSLGQTRLFSEFVFEENMDRGAYYAQAIPFIPPAVTDPLVKLRGYSVWGRAEQDLTQWETLGIRYERYAPGGSDGSRQMVNLSSSTHVAQNLSGIVEGSLAVDDVAATGKPQPSKTIASLSLMMQAHF